MLGWLMWRLDDLENNMVPNPEKQQSRMNGLEWRREKKYNKVKCAVGLCGLLPNWFYELN